MQAHLRGESALPPQKSDGEAMQDLLERIAQAAVDGDQETYDALSNAVAQIKAKAEAAADLREKRFAELAASQESHESQKQGTYKSMLKDWRDSELLNLRRGGMSPDEAESHYEKFSAAPMEARARQASGYDYRPPIEA